MLEVEKISPIESNQLGDGQPEVGLSVWLVGQPMPLTLGTSAEMTFACSRGTTGVWRKQLVELSR